MELKIKGMMCAHCAARVEKALRAIGATEIVVDVKNGSAAFVGADKNAAVDAIEALGFIVVA